MKLTINIMSYKYGHLAAQAIESVIEQDLRPDVINFYDDGASDCQHLVEIYPEVNYILRHENLGIIKNFNDALNKTETDYVMFLGADNYLAPEALKCLPLDADIISYNLFICGEGRNKWAEGWRMEEQINGYWIWKFKKGDINRINYVHGSSIYNVKLAKQVGGYARRGGKRTDEDWVLFRKMLIAGASHKHIVKPLMFYRRHRNNYNRY